MLVVDTSILIDLERGGLLAQAFSASNIIAVPDVLYARELEADNGPDLLRLGLTVHGVDNRGVELAAAYRVSQPRLSVPDSFCLALAKLTNSILVTGDQTLRSMAIAEGVDCHGLLWFLDMLEADNVADLSKLGSALTAIRNHPRCRLPQNEIDVRLARYARDLPRK